VLQRPRLVLRIYLIGLAQLAALAVTLAIGAKATWLWAPPPPMEMARFIVEELTKQPADAGALALRLSDLKLRTGIDVTLLDGRGSAVAASGPMQTGGPGILTTAWPGGTAQISPPRPPSLAGGALFAIAAVLILVGISAALTAAWLGTPLVALSAAARQLGAGRLDVRVKLVRRDELGDVAEAFNEMAGRVESLVRGQRELLANVSHELRTPLARIRVALDLAAEGSAEDAAKSLGGIAGDLAELERLTNDILTSARLELSTGQPPLRLERLASREVVADAAERFRAAHPARELLVDDRSGGAVVELDRMLLRRAVDNLLDNAAKYSTAAVSLAAAASDGRLTIGIRDSGEGMSPAEVGSLFTPFFRADRSRARLTGGLGLGLLLSRRIVEAHGGTLEIESAPGKGTSARISVPLSQPPR
jgi:signal transduction histidine kinase